MAFAEGLENLILHLNKNGYTYLKRIPFKELITQNTFVQSFHLAFHCSTN